MDFAKIIEGYKNKYIPRKDLKQLIEEVYNTRIKECDECEWDSDNKKKNGWSSVRIDRHCTNCGCTLSVKTRCLSCECPIKKWAAITTQEQEHFIKHNSKEDGAEQ